ncbi:MAG: hypothetical protein RLP44_05300 [Aggregatilineales bacterium]
MSTITQTAVIEDDNHMNIGQQNAIKAGKMTMTTTKLTHLAGLSALVAGISYIFVGILHPANVLSSAPTTDWEIAHIFAIALSFFGLYGMTGLYVRQAEKTGLLGLAGFVMVSLWLAMVMCFSFIEAFILPQLATIAPMYVDGFMGIFTSTASEIDFGILPTLWMLSGPLYMFGGLLFGIATFRAGILSRPAGVLFAIGTILAPVATMFPADYESIVTIPVGLGLTWLGYSLWSDRQVR